MPSHTRQPQVTALHLSPEERGQIEQNPRLGAGTAESRAVLSVTAAKGQTPLESGQENK